MTDSTSVKVDRGKLSLAARASLSPRLQSLYNFVQKLPLCGKLARKVVALVLPRGSRYWVQTPAGLAKGLWMNLDPRFDQDFAQGSHETTIQNVLSEQLGKGGTFYDVGAHIGFISMIAARLVGDSGAVYSFEADTENAGWIKQHVNRNGFAQITVIPLAVWSRSETLHFQRSSEQSGRMRGAVVGILDEGTASKTVDVNSVSLDEFAESHRSPTLIKIDVEGGESEVIRGAEGILSKERPVIICEIHNQEALELVEADLKNKQYSMDWLTPGLKFPRHMLAVPPKVDSGANINPSR